MSADLIALSRSAAVARIRQATQEQLATLAYGEYVEPALPVEVPAWLAEMAYDELDRRMFG